MHEDCVSDSCSRILTAVVTHTCRASQMSVSPHSCFWVTLRNLRVLDWWMVCLTSRLLPARLQSLSAFCLFSVLLLVVVSYILMFVKFGKICIFVMLSIMWPGPPAMFQLFPGPPSLIMQMNRLWEIPFLMAAFWGVIFIKLSVSWIIISTGPFLKHFSFLSLPISSLFSFRILPFFSYSEMKLLIKRETK